MSDQPSVAGSDKPVVFDHNWLFGTLIEWQPCQRDLLRLSLSDEQFSLIHADATTLLSSDLRSPELRTRVADAVIQVPQVNTPGKLTVRYLLEHKSRIDEHDLMLQLLRYQVGLYERANSAVVAVVINNGAPKGNGGVLSFRDWLEASNDAFWRAYGNMVMDFNVVILNLQDPGFQQRLVASECRSALGWYAMGHVFGEMGRTVLTEMVRMSSKFDRETIDKLLTPVLGYLQHYHGETTIDKLEEFGMHSSEESKVMVKALEVLEIVEQLGHQKGRDSTRQEIAEQLLQDGFDLDFIRKYTKLNEEQIEKLANGENNSN